MALTAYQTQTQQLLQLPGPASGNLYPLDTLTGFINRARLQVAGEGNCVRDYSNVAVPAGTQKAPFSSIVTTAGTGIGGVLQIRMAAYVVAGGQKFIRSRPFEWFFQYELNNPVPQTGEPKVWAQQGQGVAGTMWISPAPFADSVFNLDTVCYGEDLVDDSTPECIPSPWTAAVPFLAAYYALMSAQTGVRYADAQRLDQEYSKFMARARNMVTPGTMPYIYPQSSDPTQGNQLGLGGAAQS